MEGEHDAMTEHSFGGPWTDDKLKRLDRYLVQYRQIFTENERAKHLKTWYVDAFAGTGSRTKKDDPNETQYLFPEVYDDIGTIEYKDGSAQIALKLARPFDGYLFIDKQKSRVIELEATVKRDYPDLHSRCVFEPGDANQLLKAWCVKRNWRAERAVVFLDPYGMQVNWDTIEMLAKTKAVDLWYLFPLPTRLLTQDGKIEESWKNRLDLLFGTNKWRTRFYQVNTTQDLFGDRETVERTATLERIEAFIHERLAGCFVKVAKGLVLWNSRSSPLYLLCFASANEKGAPTALKIAQHILSQ